MLFNKLTSHTKLFPFKKVRLKLKNKPLSSHRPCLGLIFLSFTKLNSNLIKVNSIKPIRSGTQQTYMVSMNFSYIS